MNPDIQNTPQNQPQPTPAPQNEDALFVVEPPEKKPLDKKGITLVTILTILGIGLLVGVLVFALIGSATGLANDYKRLALTQIKKIDAPLKDIEPSLVLNRRSLDTPTERIRLSQQSQPSLENVLFVGAWSQEYTRTQQLEKDIKIHYADIATYIKNITQLLAFDDEIQKILTSEPNLNATISSDPLTVRAVSGTYDTYADTIESQKTSPETKQLQASLVKLYKEKASIYLNWAKGLESGDTSSASRSQAELANVSAKIAALVEDEKYATLFTPSYKKLLQSQKELTQNLSQ